MNYRYFYAGFMISKVVFGIVSLEKLLGRVLFWSIVVLLVTVVVVFEGLAGIVLFAVTLLKSVLFVLFV